MKVLSLFSGIGAFEKALTNLKIPYETVGFSEIDKYAITSYCAIHSQCKELNLGDITNINLEQLPECDLITHGSPCQDFSIAGFQAGGDEGAETRSSLMWNSVEIIRRCQPKFVIWENVKNVLSAKHKHNFDKYVDALDKIGYKSYFKVLNAKDYGIPQNRERIFCISIRKKIDRGFDFPKAFDNGIRLKDILEDKVDEKYYINIEKSTKLIQELIDKKQIKGQYTPCDSSIMKPKALDIANCITARYDAGIQNKQSIGVAVCEFMPCLTPELQVRKLSKESGNHYGGGTNNIPKICVPCLTPDRLEKRQNGRRFKEDGEPMFTLTNQDIHGVMQVGNIVDTGNWKNPQRGRIYSEDGCCPSLNTVSGGGLEPKILQAKVNKIGCTTPSGKSQCNNVYTVDGISQTLTAGTHGYAMGNILIGGEQKHQAIKTDGICTCLSASMGCGGGYVPMHNYNYRIRKLTPKECFRLMGFTDTDYKKAKQALNNNFYKGKDKSNSQLYKQAGNSIVVNVLEEIFKILQEIYLLDGVKKYEDISD